MKFLKKNQLYSLVAAGTIATAIGSYAAEPTANTPVPVTMTVTATVAGGKRMPELNRNNIIVKQGKNRVNVTEWVPAQGDRAGLELFILIDDTTEARLSLQYDDLRAYQGSAFEHSDRSRVHAKRHSPNRTRSNYGSRAGGKCFAAASRAPRGIGKPLPVRRRLDEAVAG